MVFSADVAKRVLVIQPTLTPTGGGEGVCAWILETLKGEYETTLLVWEAPDLAAIDRFFGTSLQRGPLPVRIAFPRWPRWLKRARFARRFKHWLLLAEGRRVPAIDLRISVDEESDLGGSGIQYVHYPRLQSLARARAGEAASLRLRLLGVIHRLMARVAGFSVERMRRNVTIVNSDWTGTRVQALHAIATTTIHPPAVGPFPEQPWAERKTAFVCVGRLAPEKRLEWVIEIVRSVRAAGHDVSLTIVASAGDAAYGARIAALARAAGSWVSIERALSRSELAALLGSHRYGLHGMAEEHFGMAVAEMVAAGMIPFVPAGGGQREIVDDERLQWTTQSEAVARIVQVLGDPALQESLRAHLASRKAHLAPARFVAEFRALVAQAIATPTV